MIFFSKTYHIDPVMTQASTLCLSVDILVISLFGEIILIQLLSMGMLDSGQILIFLTYVVVLGFPQSSNSSRFATHVIKYFGYRLHL